MLLKQPNPGKEIEKADVVAWRDQPVSQEYMHTNVPRERPFESTIATVGTLFVAPEDHRMTLESRDGDSSYCKIAKMEKALL